ncbi:MAG TPA: long-chain fatty acid--CoA ligase [Symbiobacteriaceae bacterium]|nr:long-chain fatty acid--CoA ligase [Symbiobacteriaceae bacterium]
MIAAVGDWLGRRASYTPNKEALVVEPEAGGPLRLTYGAWNARANQTAHWLLAAGIERGDRVGVVAQNCVQMLDLLFACGKIGAIFVPYNWRLTEAELWPLVADTEPKLLFTDKAELWQAAGAGVAGAPATGALPRILPIGALDPSDLPAVPPPPVELSLDDPWMILYTGGTTGRSKGAIISHGQATWNAWNTIAGWGLSPDERVPLLTPLFHTGGLNVFTTPLALLGGTTILMGAFDPGSLLGVIERERVTVLFMVPTMYQMLQAHPWFGRANLSSVQWAISGGAPCPRPVLDSFWARGIDLRQGYGLTEVGPNCFAIPAEAVRSMPGSVGFPIMHGAVRVMEGDRPCGPGEVGELQLRGPHVTVGYWRRPDATAEANPDGWFRTGDLVYRDEAGFFFIVDRKKEMFISGGENIYPVEVESAIYEHPAVAEAAVVGVPDPQWGEVGKAFVVLKPGVLLTSEELLRFLRERLARYKVPKFIEFRAALPRSAAGKILKRELKTS